MVWAYTSCIFIWVVIVLEIVFIVLGTAVEGAFCIKAIGRWSYIALQNLPWVKGIGNNLFCEKYLRSQGGLQ